MKMGEAEEQGRRKEMGKEMERVDGDGRRKVGRKVG